MGGCANWARILFLFFFCETVKKDKSLKVASRDARLPSLMWRRPPGTKRYAQGWGGAKRNSRKGVAGLEKADFKGCLVLCGGWAEVERGGPDTRLLGPRAPPPHHLGAFGISSLNSKPRIF